MSLPAPDQRFADQPILIAGGGIAGLAMALTCHQLGIPARVFESARQLRPLGVGINLQPNAVRELIELGLGEALPTIGVATREYGFYTKFGDEIWVEPRGLDAGYAWPQYSLHRGQLQMLLYKAVIDRLGPDAVQTGCRATGFSTSGSSAVLHYDRLGESGWSSETASGSLLIGADGLHSAIRAQIAPGEGPPLWNGAILWRGTAHAEPHRGGASMALIGHATHKFVAYPLSSPDPTPGARHRTALINWIAELWVDPAERPDMSSDWNRRVDPAKFRDAFADWCFDWIDVPALIDSAAEVFEYPMVDRDPLDRWTEGRTTLIGDAAHIMYPVGSNGASQAIVDARRLGRALLDQGIGPEALEAYEDEMRPATSAMILRNRGAGPDHVMQIVEERSGGIFEDIDEVMSYQERAEFAANYKGVAGFAIDELNAAPPIIALPRQN